SSGNNVPQGFAPTSFGKLNACNPVLIVSGPVSMSETAGTLTGTVSIPGALLTNLTVRLESESLKLQLLVEVTIIAGQISTSFSGSIQRNTAFEGTRLVRITAAADGYVQGSFDTAVYDAETGAITLQAPTAAVEGDATPLVGTVQIGQA